ncbi:MAG: hypothetical protein HGB19_02785 [Chlorobiales bacterium]|jgi:hypothetical protein|nr:hypothetical protein [Chlorobiales bacterium]
MRDKEQLLADSLERLIQPSAAVDAATQGTSPSVSIWLEKLLSGNLRLLFAESLILVFGGVVLAYLLYRRSKRVFKTDKLQGRAIILASLAVAALSTKGIFFLIGSLSLINLVPSTLYVQLYWLGWQISFLWFILFAFLFSITFSQSRKSYDVYYLTGLSLFFIVLTFFYNETLFGYFPFLGKIIVGSKNFATITTDSVYLLLDHSKVLFYTVTIHLALWVYLFGFGTYRIYNRAKRYKDEGARKAAFLVSYAFALITVFGAVGYLLFYANLPLLTSQSYTIAIVVMCLFYFSVQNIYRHGRYGRI